MALKRQAFDHFFVARLLLTWTASLWQLMLIDILVYLLLYMLISGMYIAFMALSPELRVAFETFANWTLRLRRSVPLSFLLGFYVAAVIGRWWSAIGSVPYVTSAASTIACHVTPATPSGVVTARRIRCGLARYLNLGWLLSMTDVSEAVRCQVLDREQLAPAGDECQQPCLHTRSQWPELAEAANNYKLVRETFGCLVSDDDLIEAERLRRLHFSDQSEEKYMPPFWFARMRALQLLRQANEAGFVRTQREFLQLVKAVDQFFGYVGGMYIFSMYKIPLVYTQVVIVAVYAYVYSGLISSQLLDPSVTGVDETDYRNSTVPIMEHPGLLLHFLPLAGLLEFVFYIGWFKIGICLLEPFGREVADIPLCDVMDQNLQYGFQIACYDNLDNTELMEELRRVKDERPGEDVVATVEKFFSWLPPPPSSPTSAAGASGTDQKTPLLTETSTV